MTERLDFNDPEYTQARLEHYLHKEILEEAVKKAQEVITEIKMNGIHQKAYIYAVCETIIEFVEELDEDEVREQSYHPSALRYAENKLANALEEGSLEQLALF